MQAIIRQPPLLRTLTHRGSKMCSRWLQHLAQPPSMTRSTLTSSMRCSIKLWRNMKLKKVQSQLALTEVSSSPLIHGFPFSKLRNSRSTPWPTLMTVCGRSASSSAQNWANVLQTSWRSGRMTNRISRSTRHASCAVKSGHTCLTIEWLHLNRTVKVPIKS